MLPRCFYYCVLAEVFQANIRVLNHYSPRRFLCTSITFIRRSLNGAHLYLRNAQ